MIGKFAKSKAGHDKSQIYVVISTEGDFVYLCDGHLKPVAKPKKKRKKHIQIINTCVPEPLYSNLLKGEAVKNEEVKYAIKQYLKQDNQ